MASTELCIQKKKKREDSLKEAWPVQWHRPSFQAFLREKEHLCQRENHTYFGSIEIVVSS